MLPSPSLMYPAKGLRPSLRAWRSNERNSFLARYPFFASARLIGCLFHRCRTRPCL